MTALGPFAARIDGVDLIGPLDAATWMDICAAFEEHSVLLVRGQPLGDEQRSPGHGGGRAAAMTRRAFTSALS